MNDSVAQLKIIRAKKQHFLSSAAKYDDLANEARAKAQEYEIAERVWLRDFGVPDDAIDIGHQMQDHSSEKNGDIVDKRGGKPDNVPPVPEMIIESLEFASESGSPGLAPSGMLSFVKQKYWPDATSSDVASTAWRMMKDGRLTKPDPKSPIYTIAKAKENAA